MVSNLWYALLICVQLWTVDAIPTADNGPKNDRKIVCHYHLNTWYAPGYRDYLPEVLDESQCTHILYSDRVRYTDLSANQSLHDGKKLFYGRVPEFRKKGINVAISFFKFNGYEYAKVLGENATMRAEFVTSLVGFMERKHFNGFNLFWGCRSCAKEHSRDVRHDGYFMDLMHELSDAFKPRGWLLSTYVSISEDVVHSDFDVQKLSEYVDWMSLHPTNLPQNDTALIAPLYFLPGDVQPESTVNYSVNYLIEKGVPSRKLVLIVSSRAQLYRLLSAEDNGLNAPAEQRSSEYFHEICKSIVGSGQWTVVHDPNKRIGTYAYNGEQWYSYNDVEDIQHKAEYIIQNDLGGGSISSLNYDDFEAKCGCGKSPMLRTLVQVLRNVPGTKMANCT